MHRARTLVGAVLGAALLAISSGGRSHANPSTAPTALSLAAATDTPPPPPRWMRPILPEALQPPAPPPPLTPAERFAEKLEALAAMPLARRPLAESTAETSLLDTEGLDVALTALVGSYEAQAQLSVHVRSLESQRVLFDYSGDLPLIPASNQKVVTSAAAIDLLGSDYTFTTVVGRDDKTLYLRGDGDPSLDLDELADMAEIIARRVDLATIERLVVDDTAFSPRSFGPGYSPDGPGNSYEAPSGAVSLDFNTVGITVFPVRRSSKLGVSVSVPGDNVVVQNSARIGTRNTLRVSTRPEGTQTIVEVRGRLPRNVPSERFRRRIYHPGLFTGAAFAELLAVESSSEPLPVELGPMPDDADIVLREESEPLIAVLDAGLAYSNNFVAEQVLRTLAWRMTGVPGDWEAGQKVLTDYWSALIGEGFVAENGSGLSRVGRATTQGLVDLLSLAFRSHVAGESLLDALPVSGDPGTMRGRLTRSGQRVRAKTGTMRGVSGLTGVITGDDGTAQVGFSILVNASNPALVASRRRAIEDQIVRHVLSALDDYDALGSGVNGDDALVDGGDVQTL